MPSQESPVIPTTTEFVNALIRRGKVNAGLRDTLRRGARQRIAWLPWYVQLALLAVVFGPFLPVLGPPGLIFGLLAAVVAFGYGFLSGADIGYRFGHSAGYDAVPDVIRSARVAAARAASAPANKG